jgi:hypothetical protein
MSVNGFENYSQITSGGEVRARSGGVTGIEAACAMEAKNQEREGI